MVDKYAVAPLIKASYDKQVKAIKSGLQEMPSQPTQPDGSIMTIEQEITLEMQEEIDSLKKGVLTSDGAISGINAALGKMGENYRKRDIDLYKFSKQCSMDEQPADLARIHSDTKSYYDKLYETDSATDTTYVSPPMENFLKELKKSGFSEGSFKTYRRFFIHLPNCADKNYTTVKCKAGWDFGGISYPIDHCVMFNRCSKWSSGEFSEDQKKSLLQTIPSGIQLASKGFLEDKEIISLIGDIIDIDMTNLVKESAHTSHKRAIWISNPEYRGKLLELEETKKREEEEKLAAKEVKMLKKQNTDAEKAEKEREILRRKENGEEPKRIVKLECVNPICNSVCIKDSIIHTSEWKKCCKKKCNKTFCTKESCITMYEEHCIVCKK